MRSSKRTGALLGLILLLALLTAGVLPQNASAHERRDLSGGKYQGVVGFLNEPAYQGQLNGLDLTVTSKTEKNADGTAKPIEGLEKTLKAQVLAGGKTLDLTVQSRYNMPGKYAAYFMPTAAGQYRFHIYGTINGEALDETFESGPNRFSDIEPIGALQFPNQVTTPPADLQAQLDSARLTAGLARNVAFVGVVFGVLGVVIAALALMRRPATAAAAPRRRVSPAEQGDD
jgi:hypothetical protein